MNFVKINFLAHFIVYIYHIQTCLFARDFVWSIIETPKEDELCSLPSFPLVIPNNEPKVK